MSHNLPDRELDNRQLRHDFANDIGSLKMNVEAIRCVRENPEEFGQLIELEILWLRIRRPAVLVTEQKLQRIVHPRAGYCRLIAFKA